MLAATDVLGGRYRLEQLIATGGMGEVWRATDTTLARTVAVKVLRRGLLAEHGFDARFRAEARTLAALSHENVVNVYDYGRTELPSGDSAAYLVMSYVDGESLADRIESAGRLTAADTVSIVAQTAWALDAAHHLGIVHRDVKPANILVRADGTVVLVDFGIARTPVATAATAADSIIGTALYMAPEQASGLPVGPATDIYSLGAVAYHCLAGYPPFDGGSALEIALRHVSDEVPPLPQDVPPELRDVVSRALAKDPAARFPDAYTFAVAARAAQTAGVPGPRRSGRATQTAGVPQPRRSGRTGRAAGLRQLRRSGRAVSVGSAAGSETAVVAPHAPADSGRRGRRTVLAVLGGVATLVALGSVALATLLGPAQTANSVPGSTVPSQSAVTVHTSAAGRPRGSGSVRPTVAASQPAGATQVGTPAVNPSTTRPASSPEPSSPPAGPSTASSTGAAAAGSTSPQPGATP